MAHFHRVRPWAAEAWGPLDALRSEMDALIQRFGSEPTASGEWRGVYPAVNLFETAETYVLTAELPGVDTGDIQVSVEGSTVTLRGERKIDYATRQETSLHRRERQAGSFRRSFELPANIDADRVEAVHRNGVLMLRLPKAPEAKPRQISVQAS